MFKLTSVNVNEFECVIRQLRPAPKERQIWDVEGYFIALAYLGPLPSVLGHTEHLFACTIKVDGRFVYATQSCWDDVVTGVVDWMNGEGDWSNHLLPTHPDNDFEARA